MTAATPTPTPTPTPRLLDCRKAEGRMGSLSFSSRNGGLTGSVAAYEGPKPVKGDYLALSGDAGGDALYRVTNADWCHNVDPANMWIARVEFIPGREARALDLPGMTR